MINRWEIIETCLFPHKSDGVARFHIANAEILAYAYGKRTEMERLRVLV